MRVENPGARHPEAMKPSFSSDRQITSSLAVHDGRLTQNACSKYLVLLYTNSKMSPKVGKFLIQGVFKILGNRTILFVKI